MNSKLRTILTKVDHTKTADNPDGNPFMPGNLSVDEAEKAIRQAVGEEMLELIEANTDHDGSARSISVAKLRQKIKEWAALKETTK